MAARRCSICGINFPLRTGFKTCPVCGESCHVIRNDGPHDDWEERIGILQELETTEAALGTPATFDIPIAAHGHVYLVSSWDICRSGYCSHLEPDQIIVVNDEFYEVCGYVEKRREYWLTKLDP